MALTQLGMTRSQEEMATLFDTRPGTGTPFSRISRLGDAQITVRLVEWGGIETLSQALKSSQTVIVAVVTTPELPGWANLRTQHTLLITAITDTAVAYHDPALTNAPTSVSTDDFRLAWSEMSEMVAIITAV